LRIALHSEPTPSASASAGTSPSTAGGIVRSDLAAGVPLTFTTIYPAAAGDVPAGFTATLNVPV
jgi:hypothetical protein